VETYKIVTEDGYILTLFRIAGSKYHQKITKPTPVLLFHGLIFQMHQWLALPGQSTAYELADTGYDVWLANARGTSYSKGHVTLSVKDSEYWNFSFHEIGFYDVPAIVDHILQVTGKPSLQYIGHSQGCTVLMVCLTTRPEYNQKIISAFLQAPAVHVQLSQGATNLIPVLKALRAVHLDIIPARTFFFPCQNILVAPLCAKILASFFGTFTNKMIGVSISMINLLFFLIVIHILYR